MATAVLEQKNCTLLVNNPTNELPNSDALRTQLESKDDETKIKALKQIIVHLVNGEQLPKLLMSVIKYCLHSENHQLKKLLLLYWEVVNKKKPDGHLLPEMILVCNAMKNNLQHANEYIRGATLRFLCNMKESEILESLIPSITANLEHRHSYVRKNAALTVYTVFQAFPDLLPDGPELIEKFIMTEANASAKRNAFLMLQKCDQNRAVQYLNSVLDQISATGEQFQLVALELIRQVCRSQGAHKAQYLRCIYNLANSSANAVAFEAANTLIALSSLPTAIRTAVAAYNRLLSAESDNNVKLIILDRLASLKRRHERILQDTLMDTLRVLNSPNIDIQRKVLALALDLLAQRNVDEVVQLLKKELIKTEAPENKSEKYRKLLVETLHKCAVRFPEVVPTVVQVLMNYVGDDDASAALDVVHFVREIVEEYKDLRDSIVSRLIENFDQIRAVAVYRVALWVLGEYAVEADVLKKALNAIRASIGDLPLLPPPVDAATTDPVVEAGSNASQSTEKKTETKATSRKPVVLADGTYAQQSAAVEASKADHSKKGKEAAYESITLRSFLLKGDFFLGTVVADTVTKLLLRFCQIVGYGNAQSNAELAKGLLLFVSIIRLGTDKRSQTPIDKDSQQRISLCIRTLLEPKATAEIFLVKCREAFAAMLREQRAAIPEADKQPTEPVRQADDLISIRQLKGAQQSGDGEEEDDLTSAVAQKLKDEDEARLARVFQLTGFGDPIYAEAKVTVLGYDIVLDILVVNQTDGVLQNVAVELSTSRDLKLVDRPQNHNIAAFDYVTIQQTIKVTSTESGTVFGNIVYGSASGVNQTVVALNSIHMDIIDYIKPAGCSDTDFRSMWAEFEWENKVAVNTDIGDVNSYLEHVVKITNMRCLTPDAALSGACGFLAANLYARSIFGEDALLNLSVERTDAGKIGGYIRIRSKAQGIALSLGDKITNYQRKT